MKYRKIYVLPILLALIPLGNALGQGSSLDLYLAPDVYSQKVETVGSDDPRLGSPAPVLDEAKAALGWQFANFQGSIIGFVPDAKIGKDLLPVDDTLIRAEPAENGTVLSVYRFGDPIEVIDTGLWWQVRVETTFPVYFVASAPPPLPAVTGEAEPLDFDPLTPESLELIDEPTGTAAGATSLVPQVEAIQRDITQPRPGVVGKSYEGVFRKAKPRLGLFKPKADFYLEGPDGKRLAWINLEDMIISGSINKYFDQPVVIHGERTKIGDSRHWIIYARNIRPNN